MNALSLLSKILFLCALPYAPVMADEETRLTLLRDAVPLPAPDILWEARAYGQDGLRLKTPTGNPVTLYVQGDELRPSRLDRLRSRFYPNIEVRAWALVKTRKEEEAP